MNRVWTEAEKMFIRQNAGRLKDKEMALELSKISGRIVSLHALRKQRQKMHIVKECGRGRCSVRTGAQNPSEAIGRAVTKPNINLGVVN